MSIPTDLPPEFDQTFRETFERLIVWRRDVRRFRHDAVPESLLDDLIASACLAPSVGNSQPWRFVRVDDAVRRAAIRDNFAACSAAALAGYDGEQARRYASLKLAGLDDAPVQLGVFADSQTTAGHGLGRQTMPETIDYSVVGAVMLLWLAARTRGLGVGWVSILDPVPVRDTLELPETWRLIAYLCIGYPDEESPEPELVRRDWQARIDWRALLVKR
jgi:5,6-dimethylbenzimidazole synthase